MSAKVATRYFHCFRTITGVERIRRGVQLEVDLKFRELLRIEVIREDVMRLKISRGGVFDETPTFAVCADLDAEDVPFDVEESTAAVRIGTAQMTVTVTREPFRLAAHRADGSVIFESFADQTDNSWAYAALNDEFIVRRKCRREDAFFGLGEKTGRFNRKGRRLTLWNTDVMAPSVAGGFEGAHSSDPERDPTSTLFDPYYVSIPFFYHLPHERSEMSGFFFDNGYRGRFEFDDADEFRIHFENGQYTEYVFAGPAMRDILSAYTWLTGRMLPPPLWALGHHQCRWFAYTQEAVEQLARTHRERRIPCDVVWLDIDYMDGYRVFTWDSERFPDPRGMFDRLREQGFRVITIIDPGVKYEHGYRVFDEAIERDVLCRTESGAIYLGQVWPGRTAFPDFVTAEARQWWGELNAEHVRSGLAGIWNDMNEPATGDIPAGAMRFGRGRFAHERYHNQYALLMAMSTVEGLLSAMPDRRTFVLSRAGSAGIQRYAANWLGDNVSTWEHLWMSIPMGMGLGVSGQPFVGADVGGFMGNSSAELLVRWFQYGALTPFCRNHNSANQVDQYPWVYGETVEELCRQALALRYRLLPYIYSRFLRSAETGSPVQKPLIFDFQDDRTARDLDDEYLLGDHLLVAPVYQQGCTARQVYLPRGTWHHWHTGERWNGQRFIIAPTPMEYIPLFARGGAVIPTWSNPPPSTMAYHPELIELHAFLPDEDGATHSLLHEDDGYTFQFRDGAFYRTDFVLERNGSRVSIQATVTGNGFAEFRRRHFRLILHGFARAQARLNHSAVQLENSALTWENTGADFLFEIEV